MVGTPGTSSAPSLPGAKTNCPAINLHGRRNGTTQPAARNHCVAKGTVAHAYDRKKGKLGERRAMPYESAIPVGTLARFDVFSSLTIHVLRGLTGRYGFKAIFSFLPQFHHAHLLLHFPGGRICHHVCGTDSNLDAAVSRSFAAGSLLSRDDLRCGPRKNHHV